MKRLMLFLLFAVVAVAGCDKNDTSSSSSNSSSTALSDCGSDSLFTVSPVTVDKIIGLVPLGHLNPSGHVFPADHIYFYIKNDEEINLYSPGNMRITMITSTEYLSEDPVYTDYDIVFSPCGQFEAYFYHVKSLSQSILNDANLTENCETSSTGTQTIKKCHASVAIDINAGDTIGSVTRFDFGAYDSRISSLAYANTGRLSSESDGFDQFHVVCPVDYFSTDVRDALRAHFGDYSGSEKRTAEPVCGEVEQDESGTAQGKWYALNSEEVITEDPHLAIVHDNVNPARGVFSSGTSISNLYAATIYFTPATSGNVNLDFNKVTSDGNIYCYDNLTYYSGASEQATILIQMPTSTTLKIEKKSTTSCGTGPWSFSTPAEFER